MKDAKSRRIVEIICPNKLRPTPTGIKFNHLDVNGNINHSNASQPNISQSNRFICPLCREQHDWNINDVVDF